MVNRIATIINYCTNDYRFLDPCVREAKKFSWQVLIPVSDHFFNGEEEDRDLLERSYKEHLDCQFIEFAFDEEKPYGIYCPYRPGDEEWIHYWHSTARYVAWHFLASEIDTVLFLDVDEIVDAERFLLFLEGFDYQEFDALRFYSYFYFREPNFRASTFSTNALMVKKQAIQAPQILLTPHERKGIFDNIIGQKIEPVVGLDGEPLIHHYSWVRTKQEALRKVRTWGHAHEKDWTALVEKEWGRPFQGTEELYGLHYETVPPRFLCPTNRVCVTPSSLSLLQPF
jgi:hypothetical protein